jgi:predicted nuclease with TOPRIM domain
MPVTARLSKLFHDRLGDAVTNELVDWFNQVDAAYKSDLREMNELNFARFDAKLEQRLAEFRGDLREELGDLRGELGDLRGELGHLRGELGDFRGELGAMGGELGKLNGELDTLRGELKDVRSDMRAGLTSLDTRIDLTAARLTTALEHGLRDQTRFFFLAWAALLASNFALWFR